MGNEIVYAVCVLGSLSLNENWEPGLKATTDVALMHPGKSDIHLTQST